MVAGFWSWVGWDALVAIGTLALAGVTAVLAGFTLKAVRESGREVAAVDRQTTSLTEQTQAVKEQAQATKRQVDVSIASQEASVRPVVVGLVADPGWRPTRPREAQREMSALQFMDDHLAQIYPDQVYFEATDDMIYCSVPLRNVGAGVAFIQRVELVTSRGEFPLTGRVADPVVPRDETTRTLFVAVRRQSDGRASEWEEIVGIPGRGFAEFTIRVVYSGASRELVTVTELTTAQLPKGSFIYTAQRIWSGEGQDRELLISTDNIAT